MLLVTEPSWTPEHSQHDAGELQNDASVVAQPSRTPRTLAKRWGGGGSKRRPPSFSRRSGS
eukprot:15477099-Alexandrium_andersonii.AAC.1